MKLVVLAGGLGTRLSKTIGRIPKALAPVGRTPFLFRQIDLWYQEGITSFTFLLHYRSDLMIEALDGYLVTRRLRKLNFEYIVHHQLLGTGGALVKYINEYSVREDFILVNADTWAPKCIRKLINERSNKIVVVYQISTGRFGTVKFGAGLMVNAFTEKSKTSGPGWINAGIYLLNPQMILTNAGSNCYSLEEEILPALVAANSLQALPVKTDFVDIGVPSDYLEFQARFTSERKA